VTRADGGKTGVGRGYGGARVELQSLPTTDQHSRLLLAAQIIWTLARSDIKGPTSSTPTAGRSTTGSPTAGRPPTSRPPTPAWSTAPRPDCTHWSADR
jgi:hypothetical protein